MKRALFAALASLYLLAACNTMEGAGKDVQKVGEKIEDAAAKKKSE
jgi:predicted small secreted protein